MSANGEAVGEANKRLLREVAALNYVSDLRPVDTASAAAGLAGPR